MGLIFKMRSPSNLILINNLGINQQHPFIQFYVLTNIKENFRLSEKFLWHRESNKLLKADVIFASNANSTAKQL